MVDTRKNYLDEDRDSKGRFCGKKVTTPLPPQPWTKPEPKIVAPLAQVWKPEPNGSFDLTFFGERITFIGGPFAAAPSMTVTVKMAKEIDAECDVDIPTPDFQTPDRDLMEQGMLAAITGAIKWNQSVFVGCMAGRGRTGLFMATVAHLAGKDDPVKFVRKEYYSHACETREQELYALSFDRGEFRSTLAKVLIEANAINFTRLRRMTWQERLAVFKAFFGQ